MKANTADGVTLITGGSRSGKSGFALKLAGAKGRRVYLATAEAKDDEMRERIARHRRDRGRGFETVEEPLELAKTISRLLGAADVVVVDCLTLWLSNLVGAGGDLETPVEQLVSALASQRSKTRIVLVSNEVGLGIVPDNPVARGFRDAAGMLNQRVAAVASEVYLMVSGIPLRIKPSADTVTIERS